MSSVTTSSKPSRKQQILESLAAMLENNPGERITTAALAAAVGVSEAALYRHFPSKSKMFEGLIEFIEDTFFTRINLILSEEKTTLRRCEKVILLLLTFAERNPGLARMLTGDALTGETERLRARIAQMFDRVETQIKQILREAEIREQHQTTVPVASAAALIMAFIDGRVLTFVRTDFKRSPTLQWQEQWNLIALGLLEPCASSTVTPDTTPTHA